MNSKPTRHGQNYSDKEIAFLQRYYYIRGSAWCARKLGRTINSVQDKGRDVAVKANERGKSGRRLVSVAEVALDLGQIWPNRVRERARYDGVAITHNPDNPTVYVPVWWAEKYLAEMRAATEMENAGWYTGDDVHRLLGAKSISTVTKLWRRGRGRYGYAIAERVEIRPGRPVGRRRDGSLSHKWLYNPWHVEALVSDIRLEKPFLTDRQLVFCAAMLEGHNPIFQQPPKPAENQYSIDLGDRHIAPFPVGAATWLRERGIMHPYNEARKHKTWLSEKGRRITEKALEGRDWKLCYDPSMTRAA